VRLGGFLVGLIVFSADHAAYACSAPSAPFCATRHGSFDDQDEFDRCRREMNSFKSEAEDFLSCIRRESEDLKRKSDGLIEEYNGAIESFNRRARG
jgi:hypothetical protein